MSRYIATRAIRGANALVTEAELMLQKAIQEKGAETPVSFPNTAYYLPTDLGMTGMQAVETLGQLKPVLEARPPNLLHPMPASRHWTPYLGETLDSGMATLFAAETIEAIRFVYGLQPEPRPASSWPAARPSPPEDGRRQFAGRPPQRPDRRHPAAHLGHPAGGRAHARLRRHRRLRQVQRSGGQDRARTAKAQHPDLPVRQRQRAQHHRPVAGRRR